MTLDKFVSDCAKGLNWQRLQSDDPRKIKRERMRVVKVMRRKARSVSEHIVLVAWEKLCEPKALRREAGANDKHMKRYKR